MPVDCGASMRPRDRLASLAARWRCLILAQWRSNGSLARDGEGPGLCGCVVPVSGHLWPPVGRLSLVGVVDRVVGGFGDGRGGGGAAHAVVVSCLHGVDESIGSADRVFRRGG